VPKKILLIFLIIFLVSSFASGKEASGRQSIPERAGIPIFPGFYVDKIRSGWFGFGLLLNSTENLEEDSFLHALLQNAALFQFAVLWRGKKMSTSAIFSFEKNEDWGLSLKFSY
jgi:hypothetical protein